MCLVPFGCSSEENSSQLCSLVCIIVVKVKAGIANRAYQEDLVLLESMIQEE